MAKQEPTYGIIDPDYARVFTIARCIAWSEGYAMVMNGSFTRDLDLLAVPWTEQATEPEHLVRRIVGNLDDLNLLVKDPESPTQATQKPHGRLAWTLTFKAFGDPRFVDLSVMPRATDATRARDEALAALQEKEERVKALEEALGPFADFADYLESETTGFDDRDNLEIWPEEGRFSLFALTIGVFRRARSVLTPVSREQRGEEA